MSNKSWVKGAIERKEYLDICESESKDMRVLIQEIGKIPPEQLKKVLTEPIIDILKKYGMSLDI